MTVIDQIDSLVTLLQLANRGMFFGLILGILQSIYIMARVFKFGYLFYIDHGFILVEGANHKSKVAHTLKKQGSEDSFFAVGYPFALLAVLVATIVYMGIGAAWQFTLPIMLIVSFIFVPVAVIRMAARDKRNKVVFVQKLEGTFDDPI